MPILVLNTLIGLDIIIIALHIANVNNKLDMRGLES